MMKRKSTIPALMLAIAGWQISGSAWNPVWAAAPKVTSTNHRILTGATQALVRATSTGNNITERGVCWSVARNPTVQDCHTTKSFILNGTIYHIQGLEPATVYYVRPYAMDRDGTVAYGDEVKIVTQPRGTCRGTWNEGAPDEAANARCREAIQESVDLLNEWTGLRDLTLTGNYGASTPTADCSYGGWMRIGPNSAYQATGTVLHEAGHAVGVGTTDRWGDKNYHDWQWKGREVNEIYRFLENKNGEEVVIVGDGTHAWGQNATYDWFVNGADKDRHQELQYIGCACLLYGLFVDGICPTPSYPNGMPGYTYNFDDTKKYYIMSKDKARGLASGLLYQRTASYVAWKHCLADNSFGDESAWHIEYDPQSGYYSFRNAESGKYLTHTPGVNLMKMKTTSKPSSNERFQLIPDRTDVRVGTGRARLTTHGYWLTWHDDAAKAMGANTSTTLGYGSATIVPFDERDSATDQQWVIVSEDELEAFRTIAIATHIKDTPSTPPSSHDTPYHGNDVKDIRSVTGIQGSATAPGLNIIIHQDETTQKIMNRPR